VGLLTVLWCALGAPLGAGAVELGAGANVKVVIKSGQLAYDGSTGDGSTAIHGTTASLGSAPSSTVPILTEGSAVSSVVDVLATAALGGVVAVDVAWSCAAVEGTTVTLGNVGAPSSGASAVTVGGTVASPTTTNGALGVVTCTAAVTNAGDAAMESSGGVPVATGDTLSFRAYFVPSKTNAVFEAVSGGILANFAGTSVKAPGTALDSGPATTNMGVLTVSAAAAQDVAGVIGIKHIAAGAVENAYAVKCQIPGYTAESVCTVPAQTAQGATVPCVLSASTVVGAPPSEMRSVTCSGNAPVAGVIAGTDLATSDAHTFMMRLRSGGTKGLAVKNKAAALQGDGATGLGAGTVLGQTSATTLGLYMGNGDGARSAAHLSVEIPTGTATTNRVTCYSSTAHLGIVGDLSEAGPLNAATAFDLPSFEVGPAATTTPGVLTCGASLADGTEIKIGQFVSVKYEALLQPFLVVAGRSIGNHAGAALAADTPVTTAATAAATAPQIVVGSKYFGGLGFRVKHLGAAATTTYTVACTSTSAVTADFTCVVPAGTGTDAFVACDSVLPNAGQAAGTASVTCVGSTVASNLYSHAFDLKAVAASGTALEIAFSGDSTAWSGADLPGGTGLSDSLPEKIATLLGGAGPTTGLLKVTAAATVDAYCVSSDPAALPVDAAVSATTAGTPVDVGAVPATRADSIAYVSCGAAAVATGVQAGRVTTVPVVVLAAPTFSLCADAACETPLPTTAATATAVEEGDKVRIYAKIAGDIAYQASYEITCAPAAPLADVTPSKRVISGTSAAVEPAGSVLADFAEFAVSQISADAAAVAVTCVASGVAPTAVRGSATAYFKFTDAAKPYTLVDAGGQALSTSSALPSFREEGMLILKAKVPGDVPAGEGRIACAETGTTHFTAVDASLTYTSTAVEVAGQVLAPTVSFNTVTTADRLAVQIRCTGDGKVFDAAPVDVYVSVLNGSAITNYQCELDQAVANAGLEILTATPTDKAVVQAKVEHIRVVIVAGDKNKGADGATRTPGTVLTAKDVTEAVEGTTYDVGGLLSVKLSQEPPEKVTVECTLDAAMASILPDSTTSTDYTKVFDVGAGEVAQPLTLPKVLDIDAADEVTITCTARGITGLLPDPAETVVRATPISMIIEAGLSAKDETGAALERGTDITGGGAGRKVLRREGDVDQLGRSVQIRLNGDPGSSVGIRCETGDAAKLPNSTQGTDYIFTFTSATTQVMRLGTVGTGGAFDADADVTFTCTPNEAGGFKVTESKTFVVRAVTNGISVLAGDAAFDENGVAYAPESVLAGKVRRIEGQADSEGATVKVALRSAPLTEVSVRCTVAGGQGALPDSGTAADFSKTFSPDNGTTPQPIRLGTVASIAADADVIVTCAPVTAAGGLLLTDVATFVVAAQKLRIVLSAGSSAVKPDGASWVAGTALSASDRVAVLEGSVDTAGAALQVALNGRPTAEVTVTCKSASPALVKDSGTGTATTFTFTAGDLSNGLVSQGLQLGTFGDVSYDTDVAVTCTSDGAGGVAADEPASALVRVEAIRLLAVAGSAAKDENLADLAPGTPLGKGVKVSVTEGVEYAAGAIFALKTSHNPSGTFNVTCTSSGPGTLQDLASPVAMAATSGDTPVDVTVPKVTVDVTADADLAYICVPDGTANVGVLASIAVVNIHVRKLRVTVVAGSAAVNHATGGAYAEGAADLSSKVRLVEKQTDTVGKTLQVALNALPSDDVIVSCASGLSSVVGNPSGTLTFTPSDATTAQGIAVPKSVDITAEVDVLITCTPTATGGLASGDTGTATIRLVPLRILVLAGTAAVNEFGVAIPEGTSLVSDAAVNAEERIAQRLEGQPDGGNTVKVRLNGDPDAVVTVQCRTGNAAILPDSPSSSDYTFNFDVGEGALEQGIKLGTVSTNTNVVKTPSTVEMTCTPTTAGGFALTDAVKFYVRSVPLAIRINAGSETRLASGVATTEDQLLPAGSVFSVVAGKATDSGALIKVSLSGNPGKNVVIRCRAADATVPTPVAGFTASLSTTAGTTPKGVLVGTPPLKYEMQVVAGTNATEATLTRDTLLAGTLLEKGKQCRSVVMYEGILLPAGTVAKLKFSSAATGTIDCLSDFGAILANMEGLVANGVTTLDLPLAAPAALSSGTESVNFTCQVRSDPVPAGITPALVASFTVQVVPLAVEIVTGTAGPIKKTDGTQFLVGTAIGYTTTPREEKTIALFEGATASTTLVSLKVVTTPSASVTFTCESSDRTKAQDIADVTVTDTNPVALQVPPVLNVEGDTTITYTCRPKASAGGFLITAANHVVKFDLFIQPARLDAVAGVSVNNVNRVLIPAGTVLTVDGTNTPSVAALTVLVYETDAPSNTKISLKAIVPPGSQGQVSCVSDKPEVLPSILSITINNDVNAVPITLPGPFSTNEDHEVKYTCSPNNLFGNLKTTDATRFYVQVVALKVLAVAGKSQRLSNGDVVATGSNINAVPDRALVAFEGQVGDNTSLALQPNAATTSTVQMECRSSNADVLADLADPIDIFSPNRVAFSIPSPAFVDVDTLITYTCTPKVTTGGLRVEDAVAVSILVKKITVSVTTVSVGQTAGDGSVLAAGVELQSGDPSKSVLVIEGARASQQVAQLTPNAAPKVPVEWRCVSSRPEVLASTSAVVLNNADSKAITLPQSSAISADTTVTYTCGPTAALGGFEVTETSKFDIVVKKLTATVISAKSQPNIFAETIEVDATLVSGVPALTPSIITTSSATAGVIARLKTNGTPTLTVNFKCTSSDSEVLDDIENITINSSVPADITVPVPKSVDVAKTVTYTCTPTTADGGLSTDDSTTFDVHVQPRKLDIQSSSILLAADGTTFLTNGSSIAGGGSLSLTVPLFEGANYPTGSLIYLIPNVPPTKEFAVECLSNAPLVVGNLDTVIVVSVAPSPLRIPPANPVERPQLVTYTCRPAQEAGGFKPIVFVKFDVLVKPLGVSAVAGAGAGVAVDGATLVAGVALEAGNLSRTLVRAEGSPSSSNLVSIQPSESPQTSAVYDCLSSETELLGSITGIALAKDSNNAVTLLIPQAGEVDRDSIVTYTCAPSTTVSATPTPTPTGDGEVAQALTKLTASFQFDILVRKINPVFLSSATVRRASSLLPFGVEVDVTGAASPSVTPVVRYGAQTAPGSVVVFKLSDAPTGSVQIKCTSSKPEIMADVEGISTSNVVPVNVLLPAPTGDIVCPEGATTSTCDETITYTCAPNPAGGGLRATDIVTFDLLVHNHGLMVLAGTAAFDSTTFKAVTMGTSLGYIKGGTAPVTVAVTSGTASTGAVTMQAKTSAATVDVNCVSSKASVIADFSVKNVGGNDVVSVTIPAPATLFVSETVSFTCTVECPNTPYNGAEYVQFDVLVLARNLVAVAGTDAGKAADGKTDLARGDILATGKPAESVKLMERESTNPGVKVQLSTTVPPTTNILVTCKSSDPTVLVDIQSISVLTTSGILGGTPTNVPLPVPKSLSRDKSVVYTCAPTTDAGLFNSSQTVTFEVFVINQTANFFSGTRATDSAGRLIKAGTQIVPAEGIHAIEGEEYKLGELLEARTLDRSVVVRCQATCPKPELCPDEMPVLASQNAVNGEINLTQNGTKLFLGMIPVVSGETLEIKITCSPTADNDNSGYAKLDVFETKIVVDDIFLPPPPKEAASPQATFGVKLVYGSKPSAEVIAGVIAVMPRALLDAMLVNGVVEVKEEDITVTQKAEAAPSARRLRAFDLELEVTVKVRSSAHAYIVALAVGDGSPITAEISKTLAAAAKDVNSPLFGAEVPAVQVTRASVARLPYVPSGEAPTPAPPSSPEAVESAAARAWGAGSALAVAVAVIGGVM